MTRSRNGHAWSLATVGLAACLAVAPAVSADVSIEAGRALFETHCVRCHGPDLRGSGHPALDISWFPADQAERFGRAVRRGKGFMPPVGRKLGADQIEAIRLFVQSAR